MTFIPYDPDCPSSASEKFAESQPKLQANFQNLNNIFGNNHEILTAFTGTGNHNIIQLFEQESAPQTDLGVITLFTKKVAGQTDQVFLRYQGNGTEVQMTNYQLYSVPANAKQTSYFTFLPGGILVYFGVVNQIAPVKGVFTLDLFPPVAVNIITCSFTAIGTGSSQGRPGAAPIRQASGYINSMAVFSPQETRPMNYLVMANI